MRQATSGQLGQNDERTTITATLRRLAIVLGIGLVVYWVAQSGHAAPDPVALKVQGPDTQGNPLFVQVGGQSSTGSTQTPITASSTGAATALTETLGGVASKTTYITGFEVTGAGATAASVVTVTVTGTVSGTLSYNLVIPAGATTTITPLVIEFTVAIPASAQNTNIVVNVPSFGAGNTNAAAVAHGFTQ